MGIIIKSFVLIVYRCGKRRFSDPCRIMRCRRAMIELQGISFLERNMGNTRCSEMEHGSLQQSSTPKGIMDSYDFVANDIYFPIPFYLATCSLSSPHISGGDVTTVIA